MSGLPKAPTGMMAFTSFEQALDVAQKIAGTDLVPERYKGDPISIVVAWQHGAEVGLSPMQALSAIAVIQGTPTLYGDGMLSVARAHADFEDLIESFDAENMVATCEVRRRGQTPTVRSFSRAEAVTAGLWQTQAKVTRYKRGGQGSYEKDNDSPWWKYPQRMLQMRARSFALRDAFADALRGFKSREEIDDYPPEREVSGEVVTDNPSQDRGVAALNARLNGATQQSEGVSSPPSNAPGQEVLTPPPNNSPEAGAPIETASQEDHSAPDSGSPVSPEPASGPSYDTIKVVVDMCVSVDDCNEALDLLRGASITDDQRSSLTKEIRAKVKAASGGEG